MPCKDYWYDEAQFVELNKTAEFQHVPALNLSMIATTNMPCKQPVRVLTCAIAVSVQDLP